MERLKSRKFWFALVAAIVVFCNHFLDWGLDVNEVWALVTPLLLFIGVEGAADIKARK